MTKKVTIGTRPTSKATPEADTWVESRTTGDERKMKRLTIDISEDLHRRIKTQCAMRGTKIADEVRELLIQKYGNQ
jgi:predicted lipoprotein